jgi:S1-C subfamily serine protease
MVEAKLDFEGQWVWWPLGSGTGFAVTNRHVLTNRHVVDRTVILRDNELPDHTRFRVIAIPSRGNAREIEASILWQGIGAEDDLAVLKVLEHELTPLRLQNPPPLGEDVLVIGFPGVSEEFTDSFLNRQEELENLAVELDPDGSLNLVKWTGRTSLEPTATKGSISRRDAGKGYLQTDTMISHGNSGGPTISASGRVVGVATLSASDDMGQRIGLCLRADRIAELLRDQPFFDEIDWGDLK